MSVIESYEYYAACPSCGAANVGIDKCEYCGASLIKKKINTNTTGHGMSEQEEILYQEDINLQEVDGKLCENDPFLLLFCPIFGGAFILVPTIIAIAFTSVGIMETWVMLMIGLFWIVGICGFAPLVLNIYGKIKCKNGEEVTGIVRGYENTMVTVNGAPCLAIRILIDQYVEPKILVLRTGNTKRKYQIGKSISLRKYKNKYIIL